MTLINLCARNQVLFRAGRCSTVVNETCELNVLQSPKNPTQICFFGNVGMSTHISNEALFQKDTQGTGFVTRARFLKQASVVSL